MPSVPGRCGRPAAQSLSRRPGSASRSERAWVSCALRAAASEWTSGLARVLRAWPALQEWASVWHAWPAPKVWESAAVRLGREEREWGRALATVPRVQPAEAAEGAVPCVQAEVPKASVYGSAAPQQAAPAASGAAEEVEAAPGGSAAAEAEAHAAAPAGAAVWDVMAPRPAEAWDVTAPRPAAVSARVVARQRAVACSDAEARRGPSVPASAFRQGRPRLAAGPARARAESRFAHAMRSLRRTSR